MKSKIKIVLAFISGIALSVVISVTAVTIINSKNVLYDNTLTGLSANVQDAIDETYTKASTFNDRITALETSDFQAQIDTLQKNVQIVGIQEYYLYIDVTEPISAEKSFTFDEIEGATNYLIIPYAYQWYIPLTFNLSGTTVTTLYMGLDSVQHNGGIHYYIIGYKQ